MRPQSHLKARGIWLTAHFGVAGRDKDSAGLGAAGVAGASGGAYAWLGVLNRLPDTWRVYGLWVALGGFARHWGNLLGTVHALEPNECGGVGIPDAQLGELSAGRERKRG
jgi:hypothetical protein